MRVIGLMSGTSLDGVTAALMAAELAATLKAEGRTLLDVLDDLAVEHGLSDRPLL